MGTLKLPQVVKGALTPREDILFVIKQKKVELRPKIAIFTTQRIIFYDPKLFGLDMSDIPYEKIERLILKNGLIGGYFYLKDEMGSEYRIHMTKRIPILKIRKTLHDVFEYYSVERLVQKYSKFLLWEYYELNKPRELITKSHRIQSLVGDASKWTPPTNYDYLPEEMAWRKPTPSPKREHPPVQSQYPLPSSTLPKKIVLPSDPLRALHKLKQMYLRGELSEEEYELKKREILQNL